MQKNKAILERIRLAGILPVVKLDDPGKAVSLMQALKDGGLDCIEITFRAKGAEAAIRSISEAFPDVVVGAGTITTIEQVDEAVKAGAQFLVSPGFSECIVKHCINRGLLIIPGVSTPSEITKGIELGLNHLKFFPAEVLGGVKAIKSFSGPFSAVQFIPTGGIDEQNFMEYLALKNVWACGGSWLANETLVSGEKFDSITEITKRSLKAMHGISLHHIGVNAEDPEEAVILAERLCALLGFELRPGNSSIFAGKEIEVVKTTPKHGVKGHLGLSTNNVDRLYHALTQRGYTFDESTKSNDSAGIKNIYLSDEFAGFRIHFMRK